MRRALAAATIVVLLALGLVLVWSVYQHHHDAEPYSRDEAVVSLTSDQVLEKFTLAFG
jgi:hypothetical protein